MPVIRSKDCRRTTTPNAVMTTLASPAQGGAGLAVWRVEMGPGQSGPLHAFDTEQVWTVLDGGATVTLDGTALAVTPGDTAVLPADAPRQILADPKAGFTAIVAAPAGTRAFSPGGAAAPTPACAMPDGDAFVPAWVA